MSKPSNQLDTLSPKKRALYELLLRERRGERAAEAQIGPRPPGTDPIPLSFAQQRLWFLDRFEPGNPFYNMATAVRLDGRLDVDALGQTLDEIVRRHEVLRTRLTTVDGLAAQEIGPPAPVPVPVEDLSALEPEARAPETLRLARAEALRPFDLARDLLLRVRLIRLDDDAHVLVFTTHHVASDYWSHGVLVREVGTLYGAFVAGEPSPLPELPIQYADYAVWQRRHLSGATLDRLVDYWTRQLAGAPPSLDLPTDRPRPPAQSFRGARARLDLDPAAARALAELARAENATLFMAVLATFDVLLSTYSGSTDVVVGTDVAGRSRAETEPLIGFFVNQLVMRADLSGDPTFRELLGRVRDTAMDAYAHQDLPFDKLVEALNPDRDLAHSPLFQVKLLMQNAPRETLEISGLTLSRLDIDAGTSRFDLVFNLTESGDELTGMLEYNLDLWDAATIERLLGHFATLVSSAVAEPDRPVSQLRSMRQEEIDLALVEWSNARRTDPEIESVVTFFEAQVARTPDAPAAAFEDETITYRELNRRANRLARHLRTMGVRSGATVGLCVARSLDIPVGVLGILKAGAAYVPLDARYPQHRLAAMIEDAQPPVIVTTSALESELPATWAQIVCLDDEADAIEARDATDLGVALAPESLAYIVYTSGSTGAPKGVTVPHRALARRVRSMIDLLGFDESTCALQFFSMSFDAMAEEVFPTLSSGGVLRMYRDPSTVPAAEMLADCERYGVTSLQLVPAYWNQIVEELAWSGRDVPSCLRVTLTGGEPVSPEKLATWARMNRHGSRFVNAYGPAEATVTSTMFDVPLDEAVLGSLARTPIGRPIDGASVYLLDREMRPVPINVPGEIYIGGPCLARGYLNRPDLTAERFVPDPFSEERGGRLYKTGDMARHLADGTIDFLGRVDGQVKIRSFRIELGEVAAALLQHPSVAEAAVVAHEDATGQKRLVAYVVFGQEGTTTAERLREWVRERLPDYMVPSSVVGLASMPISPNGKIDRAALPEAAALETETREHVEPRTPTERALATIWRESLGVERVSIHDNYFALGGDSIRSLQVLSRAERVGLSIALQQLFHHQTIAELAAAVDAGADAAASEAAPLAPFALVTDADRAAMPADVEDAYPLTMAQAGMVFHSEQRADVYHSIASLHLRAPLDLDALGTAIGRLMRRHAILRTSIHLTGFSEPLQLVHAAAEPPLAIEDLRDRTPGEQDAAVAAWIDVEKMRHFAWTSCPLMRFVVHVRTDETFQFSLVAPHAILDGWSDALLFTELFEHYFAALGGADSPETASSSAAFRDYVALERDALASEAARRYWADLLDGAPSSRLPRWPAPPPVEGAPRHHTLLCPIPAEVGAGLEALAASAGVSIKSVLLAAHLRVMSLLTGSRDVVAGLVSNGRPEALDGERVLGLFLNTLPLRARLEPGSWAELARQAFDAEAEMLPYRRYPLAQIQNDLGSRSLFETYFDYTHFHVYESVTQSPGGVEVIESAGNSVTNYTFGAFFSKSSATGELSLLLLCDLREIRVDQLERYRDAYVRAFEAMAFSPADRHDTASLLSDEEVRQTRAAWSGPTAQVSPDATAPRLFELRAARTPDAVAVADAESALTYADLDASANRLARYLRGSRVGPESVVGLCMNRSVGALVGLLGIQKAGAAYLPIDPSYPAERIAFMLEDSGARLVVTEQRLADAVASRGVRPVFLDSDWDIISGESDAPLDVPISPDNAAYVIYTSGSTGRPKGVTIAHRSVANLAAALRKEIYASLGDEPLRVGLNGPLAFDTSVKQIVQLFDGHALVLVPHEIRADAERLIDFVASERIDVLDCTPSLLRPLLDAGLVARAPKLRAVLVGGEAIDPALWRELANERRVAFYNLYGPTECAVDTTLCRVEGANPVLGRPIQNVRAYVLDASLGPVPTGVAGELYVAGAGVGRGYLGRPELTASRFLPDPYAAEPGARMYRTGDLARLTADGVFEFVGRADGQVKVRGFRVELGEIEAALERHPAVREAAVVARDDASTTELVAYVAAHTAESPVVDGRLRYALPNGLAVLDLNRNETDHLYREVFEVKAYAKHGVVLRDGDTVFDVGANIGLYTLSAHLRRRGVRVHSFEPNPFIFDVMRRNAELYGVEGKRHPYGLSHEASTGEYTYYPKFSQLSGLYADLEDDKEVVRSFVRNQRALRPEQEPVNADSSELVEAILDDRFESERFAVELRTLSSVMRAEGVERVDMLKINVEKAELDVLLGIDDADWPKIGQIVLELHDIDDRLATVRGMLEARGFDLVVERDWSLESTATTNYYLYATRPGAEAPPEEEPLAIPTTVLTATDLRAHLRAGLPDYMVPASFTFLERLPLTSHGKLDRRALPDPTRGRAETDDALVEPRTATERALAAIWRDVLGVERVGVFDDFFDLGGHSLRVIQVVSRVREAMRVELDLQSVFDEPTVAGLAAIVDANRAADHAPVAPPIVRAPRDGDLPLSFGQQRLWFLQKREPLSFAYNVPAALRLTGNLDVAALERAIGEVMRRHEVLRTTFPEIDGRPVQRIAAPERFSLAVTDLRGTLDERRDEEVRRLAADEARRPFDLSAGPLLRASVLRTGDREHVALVTMHHVVADGWSTGVLVREIGALYDAAARGVDAGLAELPVQYADYAAWQRAWLDGEVRDAHVAYWRRQLAGAAATELATDRPKAERAAFDGARHTFRVPDEVAAELGALARRENVSLYMVLLAAFKILLARETGTLDVVVGAANANRNREEIEGLIGFFINMLALRTDLSGSPTFGEALARVRDTTLGALAHQDLPFDKVVEALQSPRGASRAPLFQVAFGLQNAPAAALELTGVTIEPIGAEHEEVRYDLTVWMSEGPRGLGGTWTYNTNLFDAETIARLEGRFATLLASIVADPGARIDDLETVSAEERERDRARTEDKRKSFLSVKPAVVKATGAD